MLIMKVNVDIQHFYKGMNQLGLTQTPHKFFLSLVYIGISWAVTAVTRNQKYDYWPLNLLSQLLRIQTSHSQNYNLGIQIVLNFKQYSL